MAKTYEIRKLKTNEDMRLIQVLEQEVWEMSPIPTHQTFTASNNGGILVGAFFGEKLVGFCYGFPGFKNGKSYLCSHMMGIHPEHQSQGIGRMLKNEQKRLAVDMGYSLIVWTFDPLESRNAYLNTSILYGICDTYLENYYGKMEDGLNRGLPTDRLQIQWWISSDRVEESWEPVDVEFAQVHDVSQTETGYPVLSTIPEHFSLQLDGIEIPVPMDFQSMKKENPELALDWRMKIRSIFQHLFAGGFALVGVRKTEHEKVHYYRFIPKEMIPLEQTKGEKINAD